MSWNTHRKNAIAVVRQIRRGEWVPHTWPDDGTFHYFKRKRLKIWTASGGWFVQLYDPNVDAFGLFWRHYVWWAALRKAVKQADVARLSKQKPIPHLWEEDVSAA